MLVNEHINKCNQIREAITINILIKIDQRVAIISPILHKDIEEFKIFIGDQNIKPISAGIGTFITHCPFCGELLEENKADSTESIQIKMLKEVYEQMLKIINRYKIILDAKDQSLFVKRQMLLTMGIKEETAQLFKHFDDVKNIAIEHRNNNDVIVFAMKIYKDILVFLKTTSEILKQNH